MEKRGALKVWTILLAILAFSLSLIGTFLVRSGVLTSVHAFATDPRRGIFILAILVIFIGGALSLYAWRAPLLKQGGLFAPISREGALVFNNLFLTTACATVLVGTLYPLALQALTGDKISVGPPFFNSTFGPLFIPLMAGDAVRTADGLEARRYLGRGPAADGCGAARRARGGRRLRARAWRSGAGAVRRRDRRLCDGRRCHRYCRAHHDAALAVRRRAAARLRIAAFGLGHGVCAISASASRFSASSPSPPGAASASPKSSPARRLDIAHYRMTFDGAVRPGRAELPRRRRPFHRAPHERRTDRHDGAEPPHVPGAQYGDHRGGADDARRKSALSFARRCR